jgi:hypothetical protein
MSTRQTGNRFENQVCQQAEAIGYATFAARGSRGPVDVLAFESEPFEFDDNGRMYEMLVPLVIQVGTTNKPIASTLAELSAAPRPIGSLCLVARRHKHKTSKRISWTYHTNAGKFATLAEAIDAR